MRRITKSQLTTDTAKMWNEARIVHGIKIARVCWNDKNQYMIIEKEHTFEDASKKDFVPILYYRTQAELVARLYKELTQLQTNQE